MTIRFGSAPAEVNRIGRAPVSTHMTAEAHNRRTVLLTGTMAATGALTLAACSSAGTGDGAPNAPSGQGGNPPPAPTAGQLLAAVADIPVGEARAVKTSDGRDAIVSRPTGATVAGFSATCTHQGCTVAPAGSELRCPCHGSVFDALTGAVKRGPARQALAKVAVRVANGQVVTG
jgi:Rieske Fe-S protein